MVRQGVKNKFSRSMYTQCVKKSRSTLKRHSVSNFWSESILKHGIKQNSKTMKSSILLKEFEKHCQQTDSLNYRSSYISVYYRLNNCLTQTTESCFSENRLLGLVLPILPRISGFFYFLVLFPLFSCWFRAVELADLRQLSTARQNSISYRIKRCCSVCLPSDRMTVGSFQQLVVRIVKR